MYQIQNNTDHPVDLPDEVLGVLTLEPGESLHLYASQDWIDSLDPELDVTRE